MTYLYSTKASLFSLLLVFVLIGCEETTKVPTEIIVSGTLMEDTHWKSKTMYIIDQLVTVPSGVTLTIDAGTIIKANPGEATTTSMLVIAKGGKINAQGTAENPIIFTSINDDIDLKNGKESSLSSSDVGLWGGVIILGDAPVSLQNGDDETFYTGLDPNAKASYYGGDNSEDNSGILEYVSIRHGGIFIGTGSESNGLTLCGVGNKTKINQIEIYANQDDGIEIFGGTVNISNLLVHACQDDGMDFDEGYTGTVDHFIVELGPDSGSGIEISGGKGVSAGAFSLMNGLVDTKNAPNKTPLTVDENAVGRILNVNVDNGDVNEPLQSGSIQINVETNGAGQVDKLGFSWTKIKS